MNIIKMIQLVDPPYSVLDDLNLPSDYYNELEIEDNFEKTITEFCESDIDIERLTY